MGLTNAERQRRFRERRRGLAALVDFKAYGYVRPGTSGHAKLMLAFLLALARDGSISESAVTSLLTLQIHADRADLPEETRTALWMLRQYVCPLSDGEEYFKRDAGPVGIEVRIAPLRKAAKPKTTKRAAAKRKR
jgi:hypothetical protein